VGFLPGIVPRHSSSMNTATPFPWPDSPAGENTGTTFRAAFEHAPIAVARCDPHGVIVEMNPAFERTLDHDFARRRRLRLCELVRSQDRDKTESLLRELFDSQHDSIGIEARVAGHEQTSAKWTAWRQPGCAGEPDHALLIAEQNSAEQSSGTVPEEESLIQAQRWEAVGRLTGGVVHDFNNLLTGVMLYCDLLLSSIDVRDCRRRYADEIRSAIVQATGLVRQLLVFARSNASPAQLLSLNDIAGAMRDLLTRLIGEDIALDLHLDPELGLVNIDQAQAQQIILNLVLNARDALPNGGQISLETSNCRFQPVAGSAPIGSPAFPCVLLVVGDNGHGMTAETRQRIFEPFFTTKNAGQGTGLGLTTVRSIVTTPTCIASTAPRPTISAIAWSCKALPIFLSISALRRCGPTLPAFPWISWSATAVATASLNSDATLAAASSTTAPN
jgi:two-component system, cell cycle sensor histidine kinase and response regulator CckA